MCVVPIFGLGLDFAHKRSITGMTSSQDFIVNSTPLGVSYTPFGPVVATLADGRALVARVKVAPGEFAGYTDSEISALV